MTVINTCICLLIRNTCFANVAIRMYSILRLIVELFEYTVGINSYPPEYLVTFAFSWILKGGGGFLHDRRIHLVQVECQNLIFPWHNMSFYFTVVSYLPGDVSYNWIDPAFPKR